MLKKTRAVLWLTAAVLLVMLLGSAVLGREASVPVAAVRAESKPIYNSVTAGGTIEAERSYAFTVQENARVGEVYCRVGDTVKTGQPLWRLKPVQEAAWPDGLLQNAVTALSGGGESEQVTTALSGAEAVVPAPADCTLLSVPRTGQAAAAGLPYAQAVEPGALRLRVDIAEAFVADVQAGQRANITVSATGGTYAGRVQSVAPVAKQAVSLTGGSGAVTVSAVLQIEGADEQLRPGYSANAKIFVDEKEAAVVLPYEAIRQEGNSEYVYVIGADNRAFRRAVTTGYALSQAVEITSGISPGELVVTETDGELDDGVPVEVTG